MSKADENKTEVTGEENKASVSPPKEKSPAVKKAPKKAPKKPGKNDKPKSAGRSAAGKKGDESDNLPEGELTFRAAVRFNKIIHVSAKSIVDVHRKVKELKIGEFIDSKDDVSVLGSGK